MCITAGETGAASRQTPASEVTKNQASVILSLQCAAGNTALAGLLASVQRKATDAGGDLVDKTAAVLPPTAAGVAGAALLRAIAAGGLTGAALRLLAALGHTDANALTNIAFWSAHPDLFGTKLQPSQPGFAALAAEWTYLRDGVVAEALSSRQAPKPSSGAASAPTPVPSTTATGTPTGKAGLPGSPSPSGTITDATQVAPGQVGDAFVKDWAKSTIDLLPADKRRRFEAVQWGKLDFPGQTVALKGLPQEKLDWYRQQPNIIEVPGPPAHFTGANQTLAGELFFELSQVRPGGGERRVNIGRDAVIPESAFAKDPHEFYQFVLSRMQGIPGQEGVRMIDEAGQKFAEMRDAAKAEGVVFSANNAFRPLEHEREAEKAAGNRNAVGGISHLIGLAVDVNLERHPSWKPKQQAGTSSFTTMIDLLHTPSYKWIFMNGSKFGFYQYRQEPWHWEYNPPGFRDRFYKDAPELKRKVEDALPPRKK